MTGVFRSTLHRQLLRRAEHLAGRTAPYIPAGTRLLDIGSGTGHNAEALRGKGANRCVEVDVVDFHLVGDGPVLFDGIRLPFADRDFDACLLAFVLSYTDEPVGLLREAARVASGRILVLQSSPRGRIGRVALTIRGWIQGWAAFRLCAILRLIRSTPPALRRRRLLSREQTVHLAEESGLRPVQIVAEPSLLGLISRDLFVLERPFQAAALEEPVASTAKGHR